MRKLLLVLCLLCLFSCESETKLSKTTDTSLKIAKTTYTAAETYYQLNKKNFKKEDAIKYEKYLNNFNTAIKIGNNVDTFVQTWTKFNLGY